MKIEVEPQEASEDWGETPTLKISAFTPSDAFSLAIRLTELIEEKAAVVHGETKDSKGMFIRLPLVRDPSKGPA